MKAKLLVITLFSLCLIACNPNRVYETHRNDFPNYRWDKSNVLEYAPEIIDTNATYRVSLELRHVYGFQFENFNAKINRTSPSGVVSTKDFAFPVIGADKKYLSVCDGDYCDLVTVMEESVRFKELGTYQYTIAHLLPVPQVPNVMEFGLIIEKHEQKK